MLAASVSGHVCGCLVHRNKSRSFSLMSDIIYEMGRRTSVVSVVPSKCKTQEERGLRRFQVGPVRSDGGGRVEEFLSSGVLRVGSAILGCRRERFRYQ